MRSAIPVVIAVTAIRLTEGNAQEATGEALRDLLCEQCPYDAPVRVPPVNVFSPESRSMQLISVREMIDQLPNNVAAQGAPRSEPVERVGASPETIRATEAYLDALRERRKQVAQELANIDRQIAALEQVIAHLRDRLRKADEGEGAID